MVSRTRWLLGWGLLTGTYLGLAALRLVRGGDDGSIAVYLVAAVVTFGFAAAMLPIVCPRGDDDPGESGGGGSPDRDPPPPPWWPDFERAFWGHVEDHRDPQPGRPPRPLEREPA
jgi:hypothetical protein